MDGRGGLTAAADDIARAVAAFGRRALHIEPLRPGVGLVRPAGAFRVELAGGGCLKARRFGEEMVAQRQQMLRAGLPDDFAPVLARYGAVLLEAWVDGQVLDDAAANADRVGQAAAVLARLHAVGRAGDMDLPFMGDLSGLWRDVRAALGALQEGGLLPAPVVAALCDRLDAEAPASGALILAHTDFCGENMVIDLTGALKVIDNEHFRPGPAGMDLARCWYRWGWHDSARHPWQWDHFRDAYLAAGGDAAAFRHEACFRIAAATISAGLRHGLGPTALAAPLQCLRAMA